MTSTVPEPPSSNGPGLVGTMSHVRWHIVAMLVGFSLVSYVERMNISVAAKFIMPEFGLSQVQMGQIFSAFLLGYSLLQIPLGILSDRLGPYRVLSAMGWSWAILTLLSGFVPGRLFGAGLGAFLTLLVIRFLLGTTISGIYPVTATAVGNWQPISRRAFAYSFIIGGLSLGSAITPPIIAWLMVMLGWRQSFYVAALLSLVIAVVWMLWGADRPEAHKRVTAAELRFITSDQGPPRPGPPPKGAWWRGLRNRSLGLMTVAYFLDGHVFYTFIFWFFLYLVDVRKFSILGGGVFASLPFLAAALMAPLGGAVSDRLTVRFGRHWGRRITPIAGPLIAAAFLLLGVRTASAGPAVAALSLAFGFQVFGKGAVWSTAMEIGGRMTGMAGGIINTANNVGGVLSTALMPVLVQHFGWVTALETCAVAGVLQALLWFGVDPETSVDTE